LDGKSLIFITWSGRKSYVISCSRNMGESVDCVSVPGSKGTLGARVRLGWGEAPLPPVGHPTLAGTRPQIRREVTQVILFI